eukprot:TRINITY_DN4035_c0_g1_i1.p1 TRINITY_DN4035_c0_g1~~TRINITY_DN4035_c0_g1_i1.p1  ORF type:complete len:453 (+),score=120.91 TRINITY_DN4035_c0_g1_i1:61-1359(+)
MRRYQPPPLSIEAPAEPVVPSFEPEGPRLFGSQRRHFDDDESSESGSVLELAASMRRATRGSDLGESHRQSQTSRRLERSQGRCTWEQYEAMNISEHYGESLRPTPAPQPQHSFSLAAAALIRERDSVADTAAGPKPKSKSVPILGSSAVGEVEAKALALLLEWITSGQRMQAQLAAALESLAGSLGSAELPPDATFDCGEPPLESQLPPDPTTYLREHALTAAALCHQHRCARLRESVFVQRLQLRQAGTARDEMVAMVKERPLETKQPDEWGTSLGAVPANWKLDRLRCLAESYGPLSELVVSSGCGTCGKAGRVKLPVEVWARYQRPADGDAAAAAANGLSGLTPNASAGSPIRARRAVRPPAVRHRQQRRSVPVAQTRRTTVPADAGRDLAAEVMRRVNAAVAGIMRQTDDAQIGSDAGRQRLSPAAD